MLERAIQIAAEAHFGQTDKNGEPYILHPLRVMQAFRGDTVLQTIAVLHDVAEDCPEWPLSRLAAESGISNDVLLALDAITRRTGESYAHYIDRVAENKLARIVKRADLGDNLAPERVAGLTDSMRDRYSTARVQLLLAGDAA